MEMDDEYEFMDCHEEGGYAKIGIGNKSHPNFGSVWSRMTKHPEIMERYRDLDATLRRLMSWSTALQFIDDYYKYYVNGTWFEYRRG